MVEAILDGKRVLPAFSVEQRHIKALEAHGLCSFCDIVVPKGKFWMLPIGAECFLVSQGKEYRARVASTQRGPSLRARDFILAPALIETHTF